MSNKVLSVLLVAFGVLGLLSPMVLAGLPEESLQALDCSKPTANFTCAAKAGGSYTYDIIAAPSVLNPTTSSDTASLAVIDHIFGTFFTDYSYLGTGAQGTDPKVASVIEVSKDGTSVTYTLRKGIQYSDGSPVTVDDILYWYNNVVNNANLPNSDTDQFACASDGSPMKVSSPAPNKIQVSCPATYRTFTPNAGTMRVMSKQMVLDLIKAQGIATTSNDFGPVASAEFLGLGVDVKLLRGLGPFVLTNFNSAAVANYQRNPNFYESDSNGTQLPYVDKLTLIIIPTAGQNLSLSNFLNGTTDYLGPRPGDIAPILSQAAAGGFKVNQDINRGNANSGETLITLNFEDPDPNLAAAARNIKVRQALNLVIDRASVVQNVLLGLGTPQLNPVSITEGDFFSGRKNTCDAFSKAGLADAGHPCADGKWTVAQGLQLTVTRLPDVTDANVKQQLSCITNLAGCLDAANKLLDDAGLAKGADGVRVIPAGFDKTINNPGGPFTLQIVTNTGNTIREETTKIACDGANKIGVKCAATTTAFPTLVDQLLKGTFTGAILIGLTGGDPDGASNVIPCGTPLHLWHVACDPKATSGPHAATDDEKALTDAFDKGHAATDVPGAQAGFDAEQAAWAQFVPYMHTAVQNGLFAERVDRISNTGRAATGNDDLKFRCDLAGQKPACADAPHG